MSQPGEVVEYGVRRHLEDAFASSPAEVLGGLVVKDIGDKDAFLAVANGTGDPAVVTIDAGAEIAHELVQIVGCFSGFNKHFIAISKPFRQ